MATTSSHSFAEERRAAIMSMLDHNASVQVTELARTFGVSVVTVRADLDALEVDGKLRRTHGGAVSLHKALTVSVQDRRINVNAEAKQVIARRAIGAGPRWGHGGWWIPEPPRWNLSACSSAWHHRQCGHHHR